MNIAVLGHLHFPIAQPYAGGLEAHTANLVSKLQREGHRVTLYAAKGSDPALNNVQIFDHSIDKVTNQKLDNSYRKAIKGITKKNYDLVINNTLNPIPLLYLSITTIPTLTIFHTPPLPRMVSALRMISSFPYQNMRFAAVSQLTAQQWKAETSIPITAIYNGVDVDGYLDKTTYSEPYSVWSGRITPEKGTHIAIKAAIKANIPLKLMGSIYNEEYYKEQITPLLAHPSIEYLGHVNHQIMKKTYQGASVALVTPLWDEPFGLVIVEALLSGTPVAALPNGAVPELVTDRVGSIAKDLTAKALAEAIGSAIKKHPEDCQMYAREHFSLDRMVGDYLELMDPLTHTYTETETPIWLPTIA